MFDIYNTETYNEVPDAYIIINDEKLYKDSNKKEFLTFKDVTEFLLNLEKFFQRKDKTFKLSKHGIEGFLERLYLSNSETNIDKNNNTKKNLETDLSPKKSDLTIKDYTFTVAQKEMMKYLSQEEKEKLTDIIIAHFDNNEKRYRLKQEIFDQGIHIDNYLFADLCFCKDIEKEKEIMYDYYSGFDRLESKEQLEEIINNEYLNLYPDLKEDVRKQLLLLNFF